MINKLGLALVTVAAFTAPALAADMALKAPMAPVAPASSWTGCYLAGGGGYGMYNAESRGVNPVTGAVTFNEGTAGGRGWMGQGQFGCDYQFAGPLGNWVIGAFGDYTFKDVTGDKGSGIFVGEFKNDNAWAIGGRLGYLVTPTLLTYFSAGYTETHFNQIDYVSAITGAAANISLPGSTYHGWFLGSGFERSLGFISPSLFLKTEYRFSEFDRETLRNISTTTSSSTGLNAETVKPYTQSIITSLVWRFNWGGPVGPRY